MTPQPAVAVLKRIDTPRPFVKPKRDSVRISHIENLLENFNLHDDEPKSAKKQTPVRPTFGPLDFESPLFNTPIKALTASTPQSHKGSVARKSLFNGGAALVKADSTEQAGCRDLEAVRQNAYKVALKNSLNNSRNTSDRGFMNLA